MVNPNPYQDDPPDAFPASQPTRADYLHEHRERLRAEFDDEGPARDYEDDPDAYWQDPTTGDFVYIPEGPLTDPDPVSDVGRWVNCYVDSGVRGDDPVPVSSWGAWSAAQAERLRGFARVIHAADLNFVDGVTGRAQRAATEIPSLVSETYNHSVSMVRAASALADGARALVRAVARWSQSQRYSRIPLMYRINLEGPEDLLVVNKVRSFLDIRAVDAPSAFTTYDQIIESLRWDAGEPLASAIKGLIADRLVRERGAIFDEIAEALRHKESVPDPTADLTDTAEGWWVVAGEVTRHYGGPHEGGWWWNHTNPIAACFVRTPGLRPRVEAFMRQEYGPIIQHGNIYSALGGANFEVFRTSRMPRLDWPRTPPYE